MDLCEIECKIGDLLVAALILFFAAEEQIGSSLLIFADRMGSRSVPAMSLIALNPLVIILGGPLASMILIRLKNPALRLMLPFTLAAFAELLRRPCDLQRLLSGLFSQTIAGNAFDLYRYGNGFGLMALGLLIIGGILATFLRTRKSKEPAL